ncbi:DUF2254 domain-containing protein [soil metagenome]
MRLISRLRLWHDVLRGSYWFVPSAMTLGAAVLSEAMLYLDARAMGRLEGWGVLYTGTAAGARSLLSAISSSMIGVAGVVFSITIVALQLASSQFGPRLLRTFVRDTKSQVVLGTFVSGFLYSLLILRRVHGEVDEQALFVPQLSILVAVAFAVAGLGVLIFFVHHTAVMIQAPTVIDAVARDLEHAIGHLYPREEEDGEAEREGGAAGAVWATPGRRAPEAGTARVTHAGRGGYVEYIDLDALAETARQRGLTVWVRMIPGEFVGREDTVMLVSAEEAGPLTEETAGVLRGAYSVGPQRTLAQDAGFALDQLVEVAVRALSPGVNDPFTAMQATHRMGECLRLLARRGFPSEWVRDTEGRARVHTRRRARAALLDCSFGPLRQNAGKALAVLLTLIEAATRVVGALRDAEARAVLDDEVAQLRAQALGAAATPRERARVEEACAAYAGARAEEAQGVRSAS